MKFVAQELLQAARVGVAAILLSTLTSPVVAQEEPATEPAPGSETVTTIPVEGTEPAPAEAAAPAEKDATELDTIEVTGSRIRRTDYETAQPVVVVRREDIERTGLTNIGDILQRIPAAGSALNRAFNNGGNGQVNIDLRNLGASRVLVLVNGHRWVSGTFLGGSEVDLNTIPVSVIERIEVLKDGASAIYGSDAIAGVVNIITKGDFSGFEFGTQLQAFEDGNGFTQAHSVSFGNVTGKTSMFVNFNFVKQDELMAGDREESAIPQYGTSVVMDGPNWTNELVHTRGSAIGPEGYFIFVPNPQNGAALGFEKCPVFVGAQALAGVDLGLPDDLVGVQLCQISPIRGQVVDPAGTVATEADKFRFNGSIFGQPDLYQHNFSPVNYLLTPFEQNSVFTQVNHQFLDWLNFRGQILYNVSKADQALAEEPLRAGDLFAPPQSQAYIDTTQMYNVFKQDIGRADPGAGLVGLGASVRRMVEAGPRIENRENRTLFLKPQFDGSMDFLDRLFSYDVGYSYGENAQQTEVLNAFNMERVAAALGPSMNCPSLNNPLCVPLNLFAPVGGITPDMLEYIEYQASQTAQSTVQDVFVNVSTDFDELSGLLPMDFLSAPIGLAVGLEYRDERFEENPDPYTVQGISSNLNGGITKGAYHVREAYAELALPILADKPFVDELDLSFAIRYTEYNTFDPKVTDKYGLRWKPFDDLLVRATKSQAFRAPNLQDLFLGATEGFPALADPCVDRGTGNDVDANCDAENVPDDVGQTAQLHVVTGGNPNLDPEVAETLTAGIVYSPRFIPDFNIYVDYFDIDIEDFLQFLGTEDILEQCYERPAGAPRPQSCDLVERDPDTGSIVTINSTSVNFAKLRTSGVDIAFDYVLPFAQFFPAMAQLGTFKFVYDSQYLAKFDRFTPNASGVDVKDEDFAAGRDPGDNPLPRYKANGTLEWALNNWKASWTTRYIKGTTEDCDDGLAPSLAQLGLCTNPDPEAAAGLPLTDGIDNSQNKYDDIFYHNLQVGYVVPNWNTDLTVGVINLFDQDPPVSAGAFANSASSTVYETWGSRQGYLRLKINF